MIEKQNQKSSQICNQRDKAFQGASMRPTENRTQEVVFDQ
jgi:hypothetical protein